jgi:hypothetical protein
LFRFVICAMVLVLLALCLPCLTIFDSQFHGLNNIFCRVSPFFIWRPLNCPPFYAVGFCRLVIIRFIAGCTDRHFNHRHNAFPHSCGQIRPCLNDGHQLGWQNAQIAVECAGFRAACFRNPRFSRRFRGLFESGLGYL